MRILIRFSLKFLLEGQVDILSALDRFANVILKCVILDENSWILISLSMKFVPKGQFDNKSSFGQVMASWANDDQVECRIYVPLGLSVFSHATFLLNHFAQQ